MCLDAADVGTLSSVIPVLLASAVTTNHGSHGFFHSTGFVVAGDAAAVLAVVFWLGLASWVRRDARRRIGDPFLRFLATLLELGLFWIGIDYGSEFAAPMIPYTLQARLGDSVMKQIAAGHQTCTSQAGLAAINGLANRLAIPARDATRPSSLSGRCARIARRQSARRRSISTRP